MRWFSVTPARIPPASDSFPHGRRRDSSHPQEHSHFQAIVECKDKRIIAVERDQILAQQNVAQKKWRAYRWLALSSQGFAADTRTALEATGINCITYADLLRELVPLQPYIEGLIAEYEADAGLPF
jgi:hypothetical protein